ncbi:hypothetical protein AM593_06439, partial [Mytilus galloprovincialis]
MLVIALDQLIKPLEKRVIRLLGRTQDYHISTPNKESNAHGGLPTDALVNETTTTDICCPGFFIKNHHKGKCKRYNNLSSSLAMGYESTERKGLDRCINGTYGLDCMNKCNCTDAQKCDRKTGECKKCKKKCEDDDGGDDDDDDKSTVSIKGSCLTH